MAKFKKDGGKKKNKNVDFKKKVKVGRKIKKANETVPQVKVGRIVIKDQLGKLEDDFAKFSSKPGTDVDDVPPPHASLLEIKKKLVSELKYCASDAKPADKKKFIQKVKRSVENTHYNLSSLIIKIVLEKICCPLMYDKDAEVRKEVPELLKSVILRYMKAININHGLFPITSQSCPLLSVSLCRALSDTDCCLDALDVLGVICDLCPTIVQSDPENVLFKLITFLYRQAYYQISNSSGEMKARNKFLDAEGLSLRTNSSTLVSWKLPKLILDCNSSVLTRTARESLLTRLSKVLQILSSPNSLRCEYIAHPSNAFDDENKNHFIAKICLEILFSTWKDLTFSTNNGIDSVLNLGSQFYSVAVSLLTCIQSAFNFVLSNCPSGEMFSKWLQSTMLDIFEDSVGANFPYTVLRRSNKNNELDESATINKYITDIKCCFYKYTEK